MVAALGMTGAKAYIEDRHICDQIRQSYRYKNTDGEKPAAIVFAGQYNRLCHGLALLQNGMVSRLHISGEIYATTPAKLSAMCRADMTDYQARLISYDHAKTTFENGILSAAWLKSQNITTAFLVTEDYHMNRSLMELQRAAPQARIIARPVISQIRQSELFAERSKYLWRLVGLPGFTQQIHSV